MSALSPSLEIKLGLDASGVQKGLGMARSELGQLDASVEKTGGHLGKLKGIFSGAGGVFAGMLGADVAMKGAQVVKDQIDATISAAEDLQQTQMKTNAVFGAGSTQVTDWAEGAATSLGLTNDQAQTLADTFGLLFKNIGFNMNVIPGMSEQMAGIVANVSAFTNTDPTQTAKAFQSALAGNYRGLKSQGIIITNNDVALEAYAETGIKNTKQLTDQQLMQARYNVILEKTGFATGAVTARAKTLAGSEKILHAVIGNLREEIGLKLIPVLTFLTIWLTKGIMLFARFAKVALVPLITLIGKGLTKGLLLLKTAALVPLIALFDRLRQAVSPVISAIGLLAGVVKTAWQGGKSFSDQIAKLPGFLQPLGLALVQITHGVELLRRAFDKGGLRGVLDALPHSLDVLGAGLKGLGGVLAGFASSVFSGLVDALGQVDWGTVASDAWGLLTDAVTTAAKVGIALGTVLLNITDWGLGKIPDVWNWLTKHVFGSHPEGDGTSMQTTGGVTLPQVAVNIADWTWGQIKDLGDWLAHHAFGSSQGDATGGAFGPGFGNVIQGVTIPQAAVNVLDWAWGTVKDLATWISNNIGKVWNGIADLGDWTLNTVAPTVLGWLSIFASDTWTALKVAAKFTSKIAVDLYDWAMTLHAPDLGALATDAVTWIQAKLKGASVSLSDWQLSVTAPDSKNITVDTKGIWDAIFAVLNYSPTFTPEQMKTAHDFGYSAGVSTKDQIAQGFADAINNAMAGSAGAGKGGSLADVSGHGATTQASFGDLLYTIVQGYLGGFTYTGSPADLALADALNRAGDAIQKKISDFKPFNTTEHPKKKDPTPLVDLGKYLADVWNFKSDTTWGDLLKSLDDALQSASDAVAGWLNKAGDKLAGLLGLSVGGGTPGAATGAGFALPGAGANKGINLTAMIVGMFDFLSDPSAITTKLDDWWTGISGTLSGWWSGIGDKISAIFGGGSTPAAATGAGFALPGAGGSSIWDDLVSALTPDLSGIGFPSLPDWVTDPVGQIPGLKSLLAGLSDAAGLVQAGWDKIWGINDSQGGHTPPPAAAQTGAGFPLTGYPKPPGVPMSAPPVAAPVAVQPDITVTPPIGTPTPDKLVSDYVSGALKNLPPIPVTVSLAYKLDQAASGDPLGRNGIEPGFGAKDLTITATFKADDGDVAKKYTDVMTWGGLWATSSFTGMFLGDDGDVAKKYTDVETWGGIWGSSSFTGQFLADDGDAAIKYSDVMTWGNIWGGSTFTAQFAADNGPAAVAYTDAFSWGDTWAGQVFTATFSIDTSPLYDALNTVWLISQQISDLLPHSPAKKGPLSKPVSFGHIHDALVRDLAGLPGAAAESMGGVQDALARSVTLASQSGMGNRGHGFGDVHVHMNVAGNVHADDAFTEKIAKRLAPALGAALRKRRVSLGQTT